MKKSNLFEVLIASISIMLVISSLALLHPNKVEFVQGRFSGLSDFKFSMFDTVLYLSYLLSGVFSGFLAARLGKRKIFVLVGSLGTAVFTFLLTLVDSSYTLVLVLRFLQGAFCVAAWQTLMTIILDLSNDSNRGRNMGIFGFFMAMGMGASPVLGGAIAKAGVFVPYWVASVQCLVAFLVCLFLIDEIKMAENSKKPSIVDSFSILYRRKQLLVPSLFNFVDRLHMGFILFVMPMMLSEVLGLGPQYRGMLIGINGLAFIILQFPIGKLSDKFGRLRFLVPGSICYGICLCLTGFAARFGLPGLAVIFFILGVFSGFTGPPNNALVGDYVTKEENPLAMGAFTLFGNIGMIVGPFFAGLLFSLADFATPTAKFTVAFVFAGLIELATLATGMSILFFSRKKTQKIEEVLLAE
ncbi:MAG: MFS transporter [Spirochaetales bacterium]|nr:MFS transporter [Spirochaetales bacterium]